MTAKTSDWRPGPTVCRCCLSEGCYKDISTEYFWMGKREVYAEMLTETLNVAIAYSKSGPNSNSRLICEPCISRLRDAHEFKRQVVDCEKTFLQHLDPGSSSVQEVEMTLEEVKIERVKQEKKVSDDEDFDDRVDFVVNDDSDDDLDNEPLMKLATKVPKKEKEMDILDLLDNSQITVKRKSTASSSKAKEPPAKKAKKREIVIKPSASKASASKTGEKKKKGTVTIKWTTQSAQLRSKFGDARDNAAIILEFSNVCPFNYSKSTFGCAYCNFKSPDFGPVKIHTKIHKVRAMAISFMNRSSVFKADITDLKCEICEESMLGIPTLFEHLIEAHNKPLNRNLKPGIVPYLLNDSYACADCGQIFDRFHNLNIHVNEHYPNFICPDCGQTFASVARLRSHVVQMHNKIKTSKMYKCSHCDERFSTAHKRRNHKKDKHNICPYKCPYCSETFLCYRLRRAHLNEVHDKRIEYPCQICPTILMSSSSRAAHIRRNHVKDKKFKCSVCDNAFKTADELQNHVVKHTKEKNFKCEVCKKAYSRKKILVQHMRIHTDDRRFVCLHCGKSFFQKCSLLGHVKKHHPVADGDQAASDLASEATSSPNKPASIVKAEISE